MDEMDRLYQQLILDHARAPSHKGLSDAFDGESFQVNPMCGDQVQLRVRTAGGREDGVALLESVAWDGRGCSISQASVSVMSDLVEGLPTGEVARMGEAFVALMRSRGEGLANDDDEEALGDALAFEGVSRYPARIKCALLGWMALRDAMAKAAAGDSAPAKVPEGWV